VLTFKAPTVLTEAPQIVNKGCMYSQDASIMQFDKQVEIIPKHFDKIQCDNKHFTKLVHMYIVDIGTIYFGQKTN